MLRSVARAADPKDGTYAVELWIEEPDPRLRDGMIASLAFDTQSPERQTLAPRVALLRRDGRSEVFVVERAPGSHDGVARSRVVRTGRTSGERVEILEGLEAGEEVVVDGHFALRDGAPIAIDGVASAPTTPSSPAR